MSNGCEHLEGSLRQFVKNLWLNEQKDRHQGKKKINSRKNKAAQKGKSNRHLLLGSAMNSIYLVIGL